MLNMNSPTAIKKVHIMPPGLLNNSGLLYKGCEKPAKNHQPKIIIERISNKVFMLYQKVFPYILSVYSNHIFCNMLLFTNKHTAA